MTASVPPELPAAPGTSALPEIHIRKRCEFVELFLVVAGTLVAGLLFADPAAGAAGLDREAAKVAVESVWRERLSKLRSARAAEMEGRIIEVYEFGQAE